MVRHGQTEFNRLGMVQGSGIDAPLNETGKEQARQFFEAYQHIAFDKVYVSALQRTYQSVQGFIDKGIPTEKLAMLNEISWGNKEGQAFTPEENAYYWNMISRWQQGDTHMAIEGGESPEQVAMRLREAMTYIMSKEEEKAVLICMHGRAIRVLMTILLNYDLRAMDLFEHSNLCLYTLVYTGSLWQVELYNDTQHIKKH
ncbi:histidine phosphatase family protein [Shiella aurantiaca]|uniref:histidine phosphatase family protein n=1 Tax=Shiella aurantiaca TaxID=3058365 RepID=UPI0029F50002|nr:histidine phosphatase family protein [Shiella aurantiaca]